jgi:hypothetical protein
MAQALDTFQNVSLSPIYDLLLPAPCRSHDEFLLLIADLRKLIADSSLVNRSGGNGRFRHLSQRSPSLPTAGGRGCGPRPSSRKQ